MSMMTALAIVAALAVVCSFVLTAFIAVTFRQALRDMSRAHDLSIARRDQMLSNLLDRFQAMRWEDLAAMRSIQDTPDDGGFLTPEEQRAEADTAVTLEEGVRWGPQSRLQRSRDLNEAEQKLLDEDFPDDFAKDQETAT